MNHITIPSWIVKQPTISELYTAYAEQKFVTVPIAPGTKSPSGQKWNLNANCIHGAAPAFIGIGLAHAYSGTVAIDIDNWTRASFELMMNGINLQALYDAEDAVIIDSGRHGRGKLLYRMPFGLVLPSKKLIDTGPSGKYNYLDFRCGTANGATVQDVLPGAALHPDTGNPYRWGGNGHFSRLPTIPAPLLTFWMKQLKKDSERKIESGVGVNTSWTEIRSALFAIDPSCSRPEWVAAGMALAWAGEQTGQSDEAMALWNEWSAGASEKYKGEGEILTQWGSFKSDKPSIVKLGSLFSMAMANGWTRPKVDASEYFSAVPDMKPAPLFVETAADGVLPDWMMPKVDLSAAPEAPSVSIQKQKEPPAADLSIFPKVLARRVREVTENLGCDPMIPLWAGMCAVSAAANGQSRLWGNDSFKEPPVLWAMTIADSGAMKTPASRAMLDVLEDIEREDELPFMKRRLEYEALEVMYNNNKAMLHKNNSNPEMMLGGEIQIPPPPPIKPEPLRIKVSDVTSQKMIQVMKSNPRGILCHLDEMSHWIKQMNNSHSSENRSAWVEGFQGRRYDMERVTTGSIRVENHALSFYGNVQPDVLHGNTLLMSEDGLLQRFIPVPINPALFKKGKATPASTWNVNEYESMIRLIATLPKQDVRLSPEAQVIFDEFMDWHFDTQAELRHIDLSKTFMSTFAKYTGMSLRIALLFHMMETPFSNMVTADVMTRAIRVIREYCVPATAYALKEIGGLDTFDRWLTDYVCDVAGHQTELALPDIIRSAKKLLGKMPAWQQDRQVAESMQVLQNRNWVAIKPDHPNKKTTVWVIEPTLVKSFEAHRHYTNSMKLKHHGMLLGTRSDPGST